MSLSDTQIWDLAKRMDVPLVFCGFKDELNEEKLQHNKSYVINMENEFDEDGQRNSGSHYTCFQVNKYSNGKKEGVFCGMKMPYCDKDIQSLMNSACGWYCLAFLHFINASEHRTKDLYTDSALFTELFEDLNKSTNHLKNEYILKHFFRSADPALRTPVEINGMSVVPPDPDSIIEQNDDYGCCEKK